MNTASPVRLALLVAILGLGGLVAACAVGIGVAWGFGWPGLAAQYESIYQAIGQAAR